MPRTSIVHSTRRFLGRLWRRATPGPDRGEATGGVDPARPATLDLDPKCPTCGGSRAVAARDARNRPISLPCPECAPNDALGG